MKIGTIANNKEQCLVFYVDESFSISADEISKKFQVRIKNTMQMFIREDADKLNEITNAIEQVKLNHNQYSLIENDNIKWLAPNPDTKKIIGVAFNNQNIRNAVHFDPGRPNYFLKSSSCLIGHNESVLIRECYGNTIPEPELCLIIGKKGKDIKKADALKHVFGFSIMNDITSHGMKFSMDSVAVTRDPEIMRPEYTNWRKTSSDDKNDLYFVYHTRSKNSDTFGPMGPWVTTSDEINNPNNLRIHAYKNGECFTDDSTSSYLFSIEDLISDASHFFTLEAGDIISCGTAAKGNTTFPNAHRNIILNEEECVIDIKIEGLGTLSHSVKHVD